MPDLTTNLRMSHFAEPSERAEERLHGCLTECIQILEPLFGEFLQSLVLTGSLARGEGAWSEEASGRIILHSDVDLLAVVRHPLSHADALKEKLRRLGEAHGVGIDLHMVTPFRIRNSWQRTLQLDIGSYNETLCGKPFSWRVPDRWIDDLNMSDVIALVRHRALKYLARWDEADSGTTPDSPHILADEAHKTAIVCADLICIRNGRYDPSLIKRRNAVADPSVTMAGLLPSQRDEIVHLIDSRRGIARDGPDASASWQRIVQQLYTLLDISRQQDAGQLPMEAYITRCNPWRPLWLRPVLAILNRIRVRKAIASLGKRPHWSMADPSGLFRVAVLALHRARAEGLCPGSIEEVRSGLARIYGPVGEARSTHEQWNALRREVLAFARHGL